jgi:hypothetical protein
LGGCLNNKLYYCLILEAVVKTRVIIQIVVLDMVELEDTLVDTFKAIQNLVASLVVHNLAFAASHIPFTLVVSHSFAAFEAVHILVAFVVTHNLAKP